MKNRQRQIILIFGLALVLLFVVCLGMGRFEAPPMGRLFREKLT